MKPTNSEAANVVALWKMGSIKADDLGEIALTDLERRLEVGSRIGISGKMKNVYDFIVAYDKQYGCSPTFQNITDGIGIKSKSGAARYIAALKERGWIDYQSNARRSIIIL